MEVEMKGFRKGTLDEVISGTVCQYAFGGNIYKTRLNRYSDYGKKKYITIVKLENGECSEAEASMEVLIPDDCKLTIEFISHG